MSRELYCSLVHVVHVFASWQEAQSAKQGLHVRPCTEVPDLKEPFGQKFPQDFASGASHMLSVHAAHDTLSEQMRQWGRHSRHRRPSFPLIL